MAIEILGEKWAGRTAGIGNAAFRDRVYILQGSTNDEEILEALLTHSPESLSDDSLWRNNAEVEELGDNLWLGTVEYGRKADKEAGESTYAFEIGTQQAHITNSLGTVAGYTANETAAPNFRGAIGVSGDAENRQVSGVDIHVPTLQFSESHIVAASAITPAYKVALYNLAGKVNNAPFKGLAAGECLFLGASGSIRTEGTNGDWEISFKYAASPNVTGLSVGAITGIAKGGWDYLWVLYEDDEDQDTIVKVPKAVYVERVFYQGDFSILP